jgi:hypothetical protein
MVRVLLKKKAVKYLALDLKTLGEDNTQKSSEVRQTRGNSFNWKDSLLSLSQFLRLDLKDTELQSTCKISWPPKALL